MTDLSLAVRNLLAQDADLTALVARSQSWDTWIFDEHPMKAKIEGTSKCLIVVSEMEPYSSANEHNTMKFPQLYVDIWADPTRDTDKSVKVYDAKKKIEDIEKLVDKHLHTVSRSSASGSVLIWGTSEQIVAKTGVVVAGAHRLNGSPDYSPIRDSEGSWMGRLIYGVHKV